MTMAAINMRKIIFEVLELVLTRTHAAWEEKMLITIREETVTMILVINDEG